MENIEYLQSAFQDTQISDGNKAVVDIKTPLNKCKTSRLEVKQEEFHRISNLIQEMELYN